MQPKEVAKGSFMKKEVINVDGEDVLVREDTAKASRGVNWALISIGAFVVITLFLFVLFLAGAMSDGDLGNPTNSANMVN